MIKLKFIVIGESTVGKTSLITQFNINEFTEDYILTVGTDKIIKEIEINDQKIEMEIWDTIGQKDLRNANKIFMKNTNIALIVYDITNRQSFEKLNFWINLVKEVNENRNLIIGIAANKSDLYENTEVNKEEGEEYAKNINALFFESTAMEHENVVNIFEELIKAYIDKFDLKEKKQINSLNNNYNQFDMINTCENNNAHYDCIEENIPNYKDKNCCCALKCNIL